MRILAASVVGLCLMAGMTFGGEARYVGADKCAKMCHKAVNKGEQYGKWQESAHAKAYTTLATPAALETAKKAGIVGDPQKSEKCLRCHVVSVKDTVFYKDGVGCESCHGAGSAYGKLNIMKDKKQSLAAGMIEPTEKVCAKCHNSESPNYKKFVFADMVKQIAHPTPAAAK